MGAALCVVGLLGPIGPAVTPAAAVPPDSWRDALYSHRADEPSTLGQTLDRFAAAMGLQVKLADRSLASRTVRVGGKGTAPAAYLDRIAEAQGLDWFVYQGVLHVSARASSTSARILLGSQTPADVKDALIGLGLFEPRFGWGEFDTDPPSVLVSGPSAYVEIVRRVLALPVETAAPRERPRLMVFRLRHASASDREMRTRDRSTIVPGLVTTLNQILTHSRTVNLKSGPSADRSPSDSPASTSTDPWAGVAAEMARNAAAAQDGVEASPGLSGLLGLPSLSAARLPEAVRNSPRPATPVAESATGGAWSTALAEPASGRPSRSRGTDTTVDFTPSLAAYAPLNAILVWDLPSRREEYRALVEELDQPSRLIEINVTILDVSANALRDWSVDVQGGSDIGRWGFSAAGRVGANSDGSSTGVPGSTMALWASDRLEVRLRALESRGQAQVLSRPSILTMNNVGALLDMNQSEYVKLVGERATDLRTITAGTLLKVTPSIVGDDPPRGPPRPDSAEPDNRGIRVTLDIEDGQLSPSTTAAGTPRVGNSAVSTEALVRPGESLVVGGYRRQDRRVSNSRVPGLAGIPLIGALFRSDATSNDERERLFIVTARALP
ncbi:secretin N-terminal domain-containing protein [Roseateles sp. So40a]|uniref:secretin N-terminal domain-containing protein n=1 Tax=Roseateles sp. So40a TaxID=3400226 RepID=UPI003A8B8017